MTVMLIDDAAESAQNEAVSQFYNTVHNASALGVPGRVAFDCEGVNLSRVGTVELVSLCFRDADNNTSNVFLVDIAGKNTLRLSALKKLFECDKVEKVIHDCRMDCDALYHNHGISLTNVHDTRCFHQILTRVEDLGLNDVLIHNGIASNVVRDNSVYRDNPRFWATRPLTQKMIMWASSDVDKLLGLADIQVQEMHRKRIEVAGAKTLSEQNTAAARDMQIKTGLKCNIPIGRFIGPRGSNLRSLQHRTGTFIYQEHKPYGGVTWLVYYKDESDLKKVMMAM